MLYAKTVILQIRMSGKKFNTKIKIITEIASTHNGSFSRLKKLVNLAIKTKSDYLKFQIYKNENLCHKSSKFYGGLKKIEISYENWEKIILSYRKKIKIILEPFDETSYAFCKKFKKFTYLKISSSENDNLKIIDDSFKHFKKVFFNISGKPKKEIDKYLIRYRKYQSKLVLLYGYQSFPTEIKNLRFKVMEYIKYKGFTAGYADHSETDNNIKTYTASLMAVLSGASYLEKHFTFKRKEKYPDYVSSFEYEELKKYTAFFKDELKFITNSKLTEDEKKYTYDMGKYAVLNKNKNKNEVLNLNDVIFLRTGKIGLKRSDFIKNKKIKILLIKKRCLKNTILTKDLLL